MVPLPKKTIKLSGFIGEDKQLRVVLPDDVSAGPIELEITFTEQGTEAPQQRGDSVEALRLRLEANGHHKHFHFPDLASDKTALTDAELIKLGKLMPGARPSHELIDEDREDRF